MMMAMRMMVMRMRMRMNGDDEDEGGWCLFVSGSGRGAGCFVVGGHEVSGCGLGMGWAGCVAVRCLYPLSGWEGGLDGVDGSGGGGDGRMGCGWLDDWGGCAESGSGWCWRPGSRVKGRGS